MPADVRIAVPLVFGVCLLALPAPAQREGRFRSVFDGKSLKGWHTSAQTGHSGASKHMSAGKWVVQDGAIVAPHATSPRASSSRSR